jgi:mycothiol synthase
MATLTIRPYKGATDEGAIANLVKACETAEGTQDESWLSEVLLKLNAPNIGQDRDARLWEERGKLIGLTLLELTESDNVIDAYLWLYIHPKKRDRVLKNNTLKWIEQHLKTTARQRNLPVNLRVYSREDQMTAIVWLKQHEFTTDRSFITMARSLYQPIPEPQLPAGFKLITMKDLRELEPWVETYNESFIDHWNHHDLTLETVESWLNSCHYQPELNLIAVAPDNTLAALCNCNIQAETADQIKTGWIEWLGTRRGFRKMGLGRSLLFAGLQQLKAAGIQLAKLSVDADSPTGADRLYQKVGFRPLKTWFAWVKPL